MHELAGVPKFFIAGVALSAERSEAAGMCLAGLLSAR